MVKSAMLALQNGSYSYKCALHKTANIIQDMTKKKLNFVLLLS